MKAPAYSHAQDNRLGLKIGTRKNTIVLILGEMEFFLEGTTRSFGGSRVYANSGSFEPDSWAGAFLRMAWVIRSRTLAQGAKALESPETGRWESA
jgi:hypothetical protein